MFESDATAPPRAYSALRLPSAGLRPSRAGSARRGQPGGVSRAGSRGPVRPGRSGRPGRPEPSGAARLPPSVPALKCAWDSASCEVSATALVHVVIISTVGARCQIRPGRPPQPLPQHVASRRGRTRQTRRIRHCVGTGAYEPSEARPWSPRFDRRPAAGPRFSLDRVSRRDRLEPSRPAADFDRLRRSRGERVGQDARTSPSNGLQRLSVLYEVTDQPDGRVELEQAVMPLTAVLYSSPSYWPQPP